MDDNMNQGGGTPPADDTNPTADQGGMGDTPGMGQPTGDSNSNPAPSMDTPAAPADGPVAEPTMGGEQPAAPMGDAGMGEEKPDNGGEAPAGGDAPAA